jgi:stress-induced morphogen
MIRFVRRFSVAPLKPTYTTGEKTIHEKLANILEASQLDVVDISGGCGSMYAVEITSPKFKGLSLLKQHRMVSDVLQEEIKSMHGIQIKTHSPK